MGVSREVSRLLAAGKKTEADRFARATLRLAVLDNVPLVLIALALAAPLAALLNIHSTGTVLLAETAFATALVFPAAIGVLQGSQRFHALAAMYIAPFVLRLPLFAIAAAAGYRLGGAVFATVASAFAGTFLALALIREPLQHGKGPAPALGSFLRYLGPVFVGIVGIALLTHVDILVVKARLSGHDAGAYGAASAFARVGFFLPATILAVLFPRTAARQARGEETEDILGRSLLANGGFCGALALFYAAAGVGLVATTFGPDFAEGGTVLAPYALAIGLFSLANILVGYHLSRGETRYAWIVAGGVLVQVALLALVPSTLRGVVYVNLLVGVVLIAAHELFVGSSVPALRAGLRRTSGLATRARAVVPEVALVLLGTTAFVCALFWPLVVHLGSTIAGDPGSDATASVAWFWNAQHEGGYHLLGTTHHTLTGAPFGWDGTNALNIQVALAYYPTYLAAHVVGQVAAFNLTTLAGYILSGASMYLLTRYLGCRALVSAWAALAYIVFPWHLARIEHASLLHIEVLALLIIALVAVVRQAHVAAVRARRRGESRLLADVGVLRTDGGREHGRLRPRRGARVPEPPGRPARARHRGCSARRARALRDRRSRLGHQCRRGSQSRRGRSLDLRLATDRARRARGAKPAARRSRRFVLEHAQARFEQSRDDQLPRSADILARADVARDLRSPLALARRARAAGDRRPHCDVHRRARFRRTEPDRSCSATGSGHRRASCGKSCLLSVCPRAGMRCS